MEISATKSKLNLHWQSYQAFLVRGLQPRGVLFNTLYSGKCSQFKNPEGVSEINANILPSIRMMSDLNLQVRRQYLIGLKEPLKGWWELGKIVLDPCAHTATPTRCHSTCHALYWVLLMVMHEGERDWRLIFAERLTKNTNPDLNQLNCLSQIPYTTVQHTLDLSSKRNNGKSLSRSGHPLSVPRRAEQLIIRTIKKDLFITYLSLQLIKVWSYLEPPSTGPWKNQVIAIGKQENSLDWLRNMLNYNLTGQRCEGIGHMQSGLR